MKIFVNQVKVSIKPKELLIMKESKILDTLVEVIIALDKSTDFELEEEETMNVVREEDVFGDCEEDTQIFEIYNSLSQQLNLDKEP